MTRFFTIMAGLVAGACLFALAPAPSPAGQASLPFAPGERLVYAVRWQQIEAGFCRISVLPFTEVDGREAFQFRLELTSNELLDRLYKVRDVMEGFTARDFSGSLLYRRTSTGKDKKEVVVRFFPDHVIYSNFGGKRDPVEIPANTFDPVSSFFRMRSLDLDLGNSLSFPVTDGKKCFLQKGDVTVRETVTVPAGTFDAVVLIPYTTHFSGVFQQSEDPSIRVWISADERKIPVRIRIKVVVGSIIFDLISATAGNN